MTSATPIATPAPRERGVFERPAPPFDPFPLSWHKHRGYWFKKYRGQTLIYEANAQASYNRWRADKDAIDAGDRPAVSTKRHQLRDAVNLYLNHQRRQLELGKIERERFAKCRRELEYWLPRAVALSTPLDHFRATLPGDDGAASLFHRIATKALARGLDAARKHIVIVRALFDRAADKRLMLAPDYGDEFDPPAAEKIDGARRRRDAQQGERTWTVEEMRKIIAAADALRHERRTARKNRAPRNHHLYAQALLALFAGYGSDDCSELPEGAVNFETGAIKYHRAKEESRPCAAILPKPVIEALKWSRDHRAPRAVGAEHLMFVTADGKPCNLAGEQSDAKGILRVGRNDTIGKNFQRLLKRTGLYRKRTGFKALRAACRTLLVGGNVHEDIMAVIMGRRFRHAVDDYYVRGELRSELERASKHLAKVLLTRTRSNRPGPMAPSKPGAARGSKRKAAPKAKGRRRAAT